MLSAVGVGWPDGGTALSAGVPGLGWPQLPLVLVSSESSGQVSIERGAKDMSVNGPEDPRLPGSDRVRNALAAAVSRGTTGAVMTAGAVDGALSSDGEQMPTQPSVPESQVVVPEAPLATTGDTPIGRAAEAAVGVRGGKEDWPRPARCRIMTDRKSVV